MHLWSDKHPRDHCFNQAEWAIEGDHYCTFHKVQIEQHWKQLIRNLVRRPEKAQDSDLELLEIVRDELQPPAIEVYPSRNVAKVVKDLSLPDTAAGRNLAAWYLWEMEIFNISERAMFYEQS